MRRVGVCSWSLQPRSLDELTELVHATGVDCVQLALAPLRDGRFDIARTVDALRAAEVEIRSGMTSMRGEDYSTLETIRRTGGVRLDEHWKENLANAEHDARIAQQLALPLVTFHAGFLPHERRDPERAKLLDRLRRIVDVFATRGVRVGFETGQETAETLLDCLDELDRPAAGINFDPANMILYGMGDPVRSLEKLGSRVVQVHVKDARAAKSAGTWGEEVVAGTGQVDWPAFFAVLDQAQPSIDLMIEREAGAQRVDDVRHARAMLSRHVRARSPTA
jgi:sugar phosphate isomerase/epimerase